MGLLSADPSSGRASFRIFSVVNALFIFVLSYKVIRMEVEGILNRKFVSIENRIAVNLLK